MVDRSQVAHWSAGRDWPRSRERRKIAPDAARGRDFATQAMARNDPTNHACPAPPASANRGLYLTLHTRTGLISFDRDGTGPISDQVVAVLHGARTIRRSWLVVR